MQQAPDLSPPVPTPAHTVAADAPAKINLTLGIKGRRRDGYHELRSLVIGVGLCDRLQWTKAATADWSLRCSDPALEGPSNLVERAAQRLAAQAGRVAAGRLSLTKRIPVGGGMGGGSSDAAAALRLLNEAWRTGLAPAALAALGAELGSDVPLFFDLPAAVITGRGEQVEPVQLAWRGWVLLIPVGELVSTAEVYAAWQPADRTKPADAELEREVCQATSAQALGPLLYNDLEAAVFEWPPPWRGLGRRQWHWAWVRRG